MQLAHSIKKMLEKHHTESFGWAMCCCGRDREVAADVLQNAYLRILEGKAKYKGRSAFKTWLFVVIRNTATDWYRSEQRRSRRKAQQQRQEPAWELPEVENGMPGEMQQVIREAMNRLSPRQSEILHLVFYHGMTIEDAARVIEMPLGTARTHYERGKKKLKCWLSNKKEELL